MYFQFPCIDRMTVEQFFGPELQNNLAMLLGISADKMRVANWATARRRKRQTTSGTTTFYIEVGNPPCSTANCSFAVSQMTFEQQQDIAVTLINEYQVCDIHASQKLQLCHVPYNFWIASGLSVSLIKEYQVSIIHRKTTSQSIAWSFRSGEPTLLQGHLLALLCQRGICQESGTNWITQRQWNLP